MSFCNNATDLIDPIQPWLYTEVKIIFERDGVLLGTDIVTEETRREPGLPGRPSALLLFHIVLDGMVSPTELHPPPLFLTNNNVTNCAFSTRGCSVAFSRAEIQFSVTTVNFLLERTICCTFWGGSFPATIGLSSTSPFLLLGEKLLGKMCF